MRDKRGKKEQLLGRVALGLETLCLRTQQVVASKDAGKITANPLETAST